MIDRKASEEAALMFARKEITFFRDNPVEMLGLDLYWLRSDHSRAMARQAMKIALAGNEQVQENVVMYAREGWGLADATLKEIIEEGHNSNPPLPPVIAEYIVDLTKSPARKIRGKGKADNFLRDIVIVTIVERVRDKFGLPATRRAPRHKSACGIVADALGVASINMTEKAVETVWNNYKSSL